MTVKYLCLGYLNRERMDALPEAQLEAVMSQCRPHMKTLYNTGRVLFDAGLDVETKSVRRANGQITVTDGPFTEAKEIIGGVFLIEAESMEEAIQIASLHPTTQVAAGEQFGWRLEIRPIHSFQQKA
jgi:hypothetical protein